MNSYLENEEIYASDIYMLIALDIPRCLVVTDKFQETSMRPLVY